MTIYSCEALRVDASGHVSIAYVTIDDNDANLESQDPFATYSVDGVPLVAAPLIDFGDVSGTALDGSVLTTSMVHFNTGGFDYFLLDSDVAPQEFATFTTFSSGGVAGSFFDLNKSVTLDHEKLYIGQALTITFDNTSGITGQSIEDLVVSDDDNRIQFNGQNGAPNSETGVGAQVALGAERSVHDFNVTNAGAGDTQMVLVLVTYQTASGTDTFEALRYIVPIFDGALVYYIPRTGSVDLSTVQAYLSETLLPASANGLTYADFGLGAARHTIAGDATDNYLLGTMLHDELLGGGGNDSLVGGIGADLLQGGNGTDDLYGGAHKDTLFGSDGNDQLFGGIDDDRLFGGNGADRLLGGYGADAILGGNNNDNILGGEDADTLTGNSGADTLGGGAGNDVLDGSAGSDQLRGNGGADRFIFSVDGATDRLLDFQNGVDVIDLAEAFASLVITNFAPGTVQIMHSGEVLFVTAANGTLTAADFTAADFV